MKKYNHIQNIQELESMALIYTSYDYTENDPYGLAEQYFQFCQQNLTEERDYQIQPARFLMINKASVNAWATRRYDFYVVGIHMGTLTNLHMFFTKRKALFDELFFVEFSQLRDILDVEIDILLFQAATQFTFYHEKAHLIQYSSVDSVTLSNDIVETDEVYAINSGKDAPYNQVKHIKEYDADLYGAYYICLHLLEYWKNFDTINRTQANLELLLTIGTGAVFTYFIFLLRKHPEIYYDASDHPHPLIRILYIINMFLQTAEKNMLNGFDVKPESILNRTFRLTQALFTFGGGEDIVKLFSDVFLKEKEKIEAYINEVLIAECHKYPYLVIERMATKNQQN